MVEVVIRPNKRLMRVDVPESSKIMLQLLGKMKAHETPKADREKRLKELSDTSLERELTDREFAEMKTLFAYKFGKQKARKVLGEVL